MREARGRWILREGAIAGLFAGSVFVATETLRGAWLRQEPGHLFNLFASLVSGEALAPAPGHGATYFFLGLGLHFFLSALFGLCYGAIIRGTSRKARDSFVAQMTIGMGYGLLLWLVNFQIIARLFAPQMLSLSSVAQLFLHVFAYGLPLGWFLCMKLRDIEVPGVHAARHRLQDSSGEEEAGRLRNDLAKLPEEHRS